jgi:hypothetical protein
MTGWKQPISPSLARVAAWQNSLEIHWKMEVDFKGVLEKH